MQKGPVGCGKGGPPGANHVSTPDSPLIRPFLGIKRGPGRLLEGEFADLTLGSLGDPSELRGTGPAAWPPTPAGRRSAARGDGGARGAEWLRRRSGAGRPHLPRGSRGSADRRSADLLKAFLTASHRARPQLWPWLRPQPGAPRTIDAIRARVPSRAAPASPPPGSPCRRRAGRSSSAP